MHLVLEDFTAEVEVSLITEPQLVQPARLGSLRATLPIRRSAAIDWCQLMENGLPVVVQLQVPFLDLLLGVPVDT